MISSGEDKMIHIYEIKNQKIHKINTFSDHTSTIMSMLFVGDYIVSGGLDSTIKLFEKSLQKSV